MTEDQYQKIRNQIWLVGFIVLIISTIELLIFHTWALKQIEAMQCKCGMLQVSANGNVVTMAPPEQERAKLLERILEKQGKINGETELQRSGSSQDGTSGRNHVSGSGISRGSSSSNP